MKVEERQKKKKKKDLLYREKKKIYIYIYHTTTFSKTYVFIEMKERTVDGPSKYINVA